MIHAIVSWTLIILVLMMGCAVLTIAIAAVGAAAMGITGLFRR